MSAKKRKSKTISKLLPATVVSYWRYNPETRGVWSAMSRATEEAAKTKSWPDQCTIPTYVAYAVLKEQYDDKIASSLCSELTAAWAWNKERIVYRFDYTLTNELINQANECCVNTIPEEIFLRLPHNCFFIEIPMSILECPGFFCWVDYDEEIKHTCIRLLLVKTNSAPKNVGFLTAQFKLTPETNNDEGVKTHYSSIDTPLLVPSTDTRHEAVQKMLQFVLYLLAVNSETSQASDGAILVGKITGQKLRTNAKAYVRRAHWHHYWVGSERRGDKRLELRWLPPIPVGKEEITTRVVDVKGRDEK